MDSVCCPKCGKQLELNFNTKRQVWYIPCHPPKNSDTLSTPLFSMDSCTGSFGDVVAQKKER